MKRIILDAEPAEVKRFIRTLPVDLEGVELELDGRVIGKVIPSTFFSEAEKKALVHDRWQMIRRAQERNKGVSTEAIEREIQESVEEVRGQKQQ